MKTNYVASKQITLITNTFPVEHTNVTSARLSNLTKKTANRFLNSSSELKKTYVDLITTNASLGNSTNKVCIRRSLTNILEKGSIIERDNDLLLAKLD